MSSPNHPKPKANKGRKKVKLEKMQNQGNLQVTFTKRRNGVMKKASEINTLCGAEFSVIVACPKGKPYGLGHPTIKKVFDKHVVANPDAPPVDALNPIVEAQRSARIRELNLQLTHYQGMLAKEKKRSRELDNIKKQGRIEKWYPPPLEEFSLEELLIYKKSIENFGKHFDECAAKAMHSANHQSCALPMQYDATNNTYYTPSFQNDDENIHAAGVSSFTVDPGSSHPNSFPVEYAPRNNEGVAGSSFSGNPNSSTPPFGFNFDDLSTGFVNPGQYGAISNVTNEMSNNQIANQESFNHLLSGLSDPSSYSSMNHSRDEPNMSSMAGGSTLYNAFNNDIIGSSASPYGFNGGTSGSGSQSLFNDGTGGSTSQFNGGTMDLGQHGGFNDDTMTLGPRSGFNGGDVDLGQHSGFNSGTIDFGQNCGFNSNLEHHSGFNDVTMNLGQHTGFNSGTVNLDLHRGFNDTHSGFNGGTMDLDTHGGFNIDTVNLGQQSGFNSGILDLDPHSGFNIVTGDLGQHSGFNVDTLDLGHHNEFNSGTLNLDPHSGFNVDTLDQHSGFNGDAVDLGQLSGFNSGPLDLGQLSGFNGGTADLGQLSGFNGGTADLGQLNGFNGGTADLGPLSGFENDTMDLGPHSGFNTDTMDLGQHNGFNNDIIDFGQPSGFNNDTIDLDQLRGFNNGDGGFDY